MDNISKRNKNTEKVNNSSENKVKNEQDGDIQKEKHIIARPGNRPNLTIRRPNTGGYNTYLLNPTSPAAYSFFPQQQARSEHGIIESPLRKEFMEDSPFNESLVSPVNMFNFPYANQNISNQFSNYNNRNINPNYLNNYHNSSLEDLHYSNPLSRQTTLNNYSYMNLSSEVHFQDSPAIQNCIPSYFNNLPPQQHLSSHENNNSNINEYCQKPQFEFPNTSVPLNNLSVQLPTLRQVENGCSEGGTRYSSNNTTTNFDEEGRGRAENWQHQETKQFINILLKYKTEFKSIRRNQNLWNTISKEMIQCGYNRNVEKCKNRWKVLVAKFKRFEAKMGSGSHEYDNFTIGSGIASNTNNGTCNSVLEYYNELKLLLEGLYTISPNGVIKKIRKYQTNTGNDHSTLSASPTITPNTIDFNRRNSDSFKREPLISPLAQDSRLYNDDNEKYTEYYNSNVQSDNNSYNNRGQRH